MSIYCYKCVVNGYLSLMSPYVALMSIYRYTVWVNGQMFRSNVDLLLYVWLK